MASITAANSGDRSNKASEAAKISKVRLKIMPRSEDHAKIGAATATFVETARAIAAESSE